MASLIAGPQALGIQASVAAAQGLSSCGSWALDCGISSRGATGLFTAPPGSPYKTFLRPEAYLTTGVFADPF